MLTFVVMVKNGCTAKGTANRLSNVTEINAEDV